MRNPFRTPLKRKCRAGLYRVRRTNSGRAQPRRIVDGRVVLSFCSNDYLGLAADKRVIQAFHSGLERFGAGAGASSMVNGYTAAHQALEEQLADFTGRARALLFSTGYMANLGTLRALVESHGTRNSVVVEDRLNHASLIDAALLARARFQRYPHADVSALKRLLATAPIRNAVVATDAVFSMDGDIAPLAALAQCCATHGATLLVDDAHGFGVLGADGGGALQQQGLSQDQVPVLVATFGKACGTFGAFVAGSEALIEWLIQEARTYIYTTALPPAIACATLESLRLLKEQPWRRDKLHHNVTLFQQLAHEAGLPCGQSCTPIQPLIVGDAAPTLALSEALLGDGLEVQAIRPPTVPQGTSRLRITLSAAHEAEDIRRLIDALVVRMSRVGVQRVSERVAHPATPCCESRAGSCPEPLVETAGAVRSPSREGYAR